MSSRELSPSSPVGRKKKKKAKKMPSGQSELKSGKENEASTTVILKNVLPLVT